MSATEDGTAGSLPPFPEHDHGHEARHERGAAAGHDHDHDAPAGHGHGHDAPAGHDHDHDAPAGNDHAGHGHEHGEHDHDDHDEHAGHGHDHDGHDHDEHAGHEHAGHGHEHAGHEHGEHGHEHAGGLRGLVLSVVRPHSHDAADSFDATLEASAEGMQALKISLAGLAVTAVLQVLIFSISGSVALLADTIHNFADALTAIPLAAAFVLSRRPATTRYTYGFGRSEDLAGVAIVLTIAASSVVAAGEAVDRLVHPSSVHHLWWVALAGVVGFAGNELVARYRIRVGRRIGSAALEADGYHARTDGFTSLAVVLGAAGVAAGWRLADPVIGLLITVAILLVVKNAARDIYRRLMDAVDPALVAKVTEVLAGVEGVVTVDQVRIRWIGHELHAEADITSDGSMTLVEAHDVAEHAHHHLLHQVPRLREATIHSSPWVPGGHDPHTRTAHHRPPGA